MTVAEHDVPPRWHIPARVLDVFAVDARTARLDATRHMHILGGLPPWRPLLRVTYRQTHATPIDEERSAP